MNFKIIAFQSIQFGINQTKKNSLKLKLFYNFQNRIINEPIRTEPILLRRVGWYVSAIVDGTIRSNNYRLIEYKLLI